MTNFIISRLVLWMIVLSGGQYLSKSTPPNENGSNLRPYQSLQIAAIRQPTVKKSRRVCILTTTAHMGKAVSFKSQEAASQFIDNMLRTNAAACFQIQQSRNTWTVKRVEAVAA